jgi:hypothetical protein
MDVSGGLPYPVATIALNDANATLADLYVLKSWTVDATSAITISGDRPAIVLVLTTVDIQGTASVTAGGFQSGSAPGPGVGPNTDNTGSGGSYCGVGGAGALMGGLSSTGTTYGTSTLTPLVGGSAGGENCGLGAGGGAVQIVAGVSISVRQSGSISAPGGGGCSGGGSGGAILLEAPSVQIAGSVAANGGSGGAASNGVAGTAGSTGAPGASGGAGTAMGGSGSAGSTINGGPGTYASGSGGGGGGGAGRIRINTMTGSAAITGTVSPQWGAQDSGATVCATQGTLGP